MLCEASPSDIVDAMLLRRGAGNPGNSRWIDGSFGCRETGWMEWKLAEWQAGWRTWSAAELHEPMSPGPQQACPGPPRCGPPLGGDALPHATTATSRHSRRLRRYEETHASSISPVLCAVLCCLSCAPSTIRNVTLRVLRSSPTAATPSIPPFPGRDDDPAGDLRRELWPRRLLPRHRSPHFQVVSCHRAAADADADSEAAAAVSLWANNKLFYLPNPNKPQNLVSSS